MPRAASTRALILLGLLSIAQVAVTVKHENFKTCAQSGFCKRNRALADQAAAVGPAWISPYELEADSVTLEKGVLSASIWKDITLSNGESSKIELPLSISLLDNGVARVTIDERKRQQKDIDLRGGSKARKERYSEAEKWALVGGKNHHEDASLEKNKGTTTVTYGFGGNNKLVIEHKPFKVSFLRDGELQIVLNDRKLMNVEHWRPKIEKPEGEEVPEGTEASQGGEDESTWWDESFGGNTDSKPRGPEAVAMDITFPGYQWVYGIPEHASSLSLKETRGGEGNYEDPYRLYNSDVFEYEIDSPMTLYGSIPFMQAQKKDSTVGVFWLNAAETWIDIIKSRPSKDTMSNERGSTHTHWISESGLLDIFVLPGPTSAWLYEQYGALTGYTTLPAEFSLGYHQCRWNYVSQEDVKDVDRKFDKFDIPYDVIWLDIEYTDGKKYFTWDPLNFKDPVSMQDTLAKRDRKLVAIIDPHIKNENGYDISKQMNDQGLAVKDKEGEKSYDGWCWPGSSHWVDCFNPAAIKWWKSLFDIKTFPFATPNLHIWNDMNEPSVFNGPETTMPKDNLHYDNWEHRDVHNLNGMTFHNATYEGMVARLGKGKERRPFVLTRSFYAGSQRTAAMWTGDNQADWSHLAQGFPMILNQGIAGMPFAGADVGGFFGNPSKELFTRWYQAGAFYPFFRGHAHIDAKRREPYLYEEPYRSIVRDAIRLRYSLLPVWYTAFHRANFEGMPVIRPHFVMFPGDEAGFELDDQFFLGDSGLLAKPVVTEGATTVDIYIPDDEPYYDYFNHMVYRGRGYKTVPAPLNALPLLMRGGHIIPRKDRHRRSSGLMKYDPYTLVVNINNQGVAGGVLYVDDGETFENEKGAYIHRSFIFRQAEGTLASGNIHKDPTSAKAKEYFSQMKSVRVERVILVGVSDEWLNKATVEVTVGGKTFETSITVTKGHDGKANVAVVRDPKAPITEDWTIKF
ncbi:glycosyl hydrolases family 31-domain-containing protein [Geopyxis carbonaria]|nr:glycosyl hydrolases family 31-domain-containing protein [Geopyxis carbonaria]